MRSPLKPTLVKTLFAGVLLSLAASAPAFAQSTMQPGPAMAEAVMWHPSQRPVWSEPFAPTGQPPRAVAYARPRSQEFLGRADDMDQWLISAAER
jgi:hypothetical protein